ncbi:hypothetical protein CD178_00574 [Komagataeibacter saccharivorans]|uniref:Uncharacterized protein n=1 Tax=Komagataeibacter saccharivorans TaxID=265959 RepID=A0A347W946_9PROT|nr:hypothetical protein [Komagataeibacter saccharivorans]AXY21389.1 hypothetical protein CD178_00574 [Komagataeibacter saccharivorans]
MEKQGSRALLAAVIGMGVLLFVGSLVLVGVLVHRMMHPSIAATRPAVSASVPTLPAQGGYEALMLDEPAGTHVESLTTRPDGMIAVALSGGGSAERIILWDPAGRRIVARLLIGR